MINKHLQNNSRRKATLVQLVGGNIDRLVMIVQGLIIIPLCVFYLGNYVYGVWLTVVSIIMWLDVFGVGISGLSNQRISYYYGKKELKTAADYFHNGLLIYIILFIFFSLTGIVASFYLSYWFDISPAESDIIEICFQIVVFSAAIEFLNNYLRSFSNALLTPLMVTISRVISRIVGLLTTIALLINDYGLWSIAIGTLLSALLALIANIYCSLSNLNHLSAKISFKRKIIKDYLMHGPVLFMGTGANAIIRSIEPIFITVFLNPELVPLFVITRRAGELIQQLPQVLSISVFSSFSHIYAEGDIYKIRSILKVLLDMQLYLSLFGFAAYVLFNGSFISLWVESEYYLGINMTIAMSLSLYFMVFKQFFSKILMSVGDINYSSITNLLEASIRLSIMYVAVNFCGLIGLPMGMALSCMLFSMLYFYRLNNIDILSSREIKNSLMFMCVSIILILFSSVFSNFILVNSWLIFFCYAALFIFIGMMFFLLMNKTIKYEIIKTLKLIKH